MKRFKFSAMALFAVVIAIATSAFTVNEKASRSKHFDNWYEFQGTYSLGAVKSESSYVWVETHTGCGSDEKVCAVNLPGATGANAHPDTFVGDIPQELEDAYYNTAQAGYIDMSPE